MRCVLLMLLVMVCGIAVPVYAQPQSKTQLFKIVFDKERDWRNVEEDGKKWLEVTFQLEGTAEAKAHGGRYKIVIEEEGRRVHEQPLTMLPDNLTAVLAVDISNSMELIDNEKLGKRRIDLAKDAAKVFFDSLEKQVDCGLILFDDKIQTEEAPCGDPKAVLAHRAKLKQLVERAEPGGGTAYIDAIARAVDMLENVKGRKAIVLVTDGVDLHSKHKREDVVRRARAANITIWTIGIGEPGKSLRMSAVLALDKSGSMKEPADDGDPTPKIQALRKAATQFIDSLHPQAEISLLPFSTKVGIPGEFSRDVGERRALKQKIKALEPEGETAFLSAAYTAIGTLEAYDPPGMRLVVVLTDGVDNSSRHRMEDVIARAKDARVRLYMLAFGRAGELDRATMEKLAADTGGSYKHARNEKELLEIFQKLSIDLDDRGIDEDALKWIARETKGAYQHSRDLSNLSGIFAKLAQDVQSRYSLRFQSHRQVADGTARPISIYVVDNEGQAVSDVTGFVNVVRGVVVPQMNSFVYLLFLAILGGLVALPPLLRKLKRPSAEA